MHCLVFVIATLFLSDVRSAPEIVGTIKAYYESDSIKLFRKAWELHRRPMQHAIKSALAETAGLPGMNVYIRKHPEKLAVGYMHNDNNVQIVFSDLYLKGMPRCRMPDLQFPLSSNIIKIETQLSKIIIHADYSLARDKDHIIHETQDQDPLKYSPFLFVQVDETGKIAIRADGCTLTGFIIATLGAESVNLGYDYFKLANCAYTIEVYNSNKSSLPVIAKYNLDRVNEAGLGLTDLMLRPLLTEELMPKIQGAIFSFVNTSAIFGTKLSSYKQNQETVFKKTEQYMINVIRSLNLKTVNTNKGLLNMKDFILKWNDKSSVSLTGMELFGVDTMYPAHSGGPVLMKHVMIAEEIRFSSLQVRGNFLAISEESEISLTFAAEISDLVLDIHMEEKNWEEGIKLLEVKGLSRMIVTISSLTNGMEESLIGAHLLNEVPKLIHKHLSGIFHSAVNPNKT